MLSDRGSSETLAPIPSLLLTGAVHHHLIQERTRTKIGLVIETGEARECHHMALLIGYGAGAVNPYLAIETVEDLVDSGALAIDKRKAVRNLIKAYGKGVIKVMSKMGVSTVASYTGAQIFEALGLSQEVIDSCFTGTTSRLGGVGFDVLAREVGRTAPARLPARGERAPAAAGRRRVPVAPRGRAAPVQPRDGLQAAARHPHAAATRSSRSTPAWWTPRPSG